MGVSSNQTVRRDMNGSVGERKQRMAILKVPERGGHLPLAPYFSLLLRSLVMDIPSTFQMFSWIFAEATVHTQKTVAFMSSMQTVTKGISSLLRITVSLALLRSECHGTLLFSRSAFFLKLSSSLVTAVSPSPSWSCLACLAHPAACIVALGLHSPTIYFLSTFCKSLTLRSNLFSPCHPKAETSSDLLSAVCAPHIQSNGQSLWKETLYTTLQEKEINCVTWMLHKTGQSNVHSPNSYQSTHTNPNGILVLLDKGEVADKCRIQETRARNWILLPFDAPGSTTESNKQQTSWWFN